MKIDLSIMARSRLCASGFTLVIIALVMAGLAGCSAQNPAADFSRSSSQAWQSPSSYPPSINPVIVPHAEVASWYGPGFQGHPTSTGERFNEYGMTAASRTLPLGSRVRVTNPANGRSIEVRINDRGPYVRGRSLDLSKAAAQKLGMTRTGVAPVVVASASAVPVTSRNWPRERSMTVGYHLPPRRVARKQWVEPVVYSRHRSSRRHHRRKVWNPVGAWIASALPRF